MYQDEIVYPHYEVSIDLKLDENTHDEWSNIFGFHQANPSYTKEDGFALGGRIPAVFVQSGKNAQYCIKITSSDDDRGDLSVAERS